MAERHSAGLLPERGTSTVLLSEAEALIAELVSPRTYDEFFGEVVERKPWSIVGQPSSLRPTLLGRDPAQTLLNAFDTHSANLVSHAGAPKGAAPVPRRVADAAGFAALVREYHQRNFTVRMPEITGLNAQLQQVVRALEIVLRKKVTAMAFWSDAGASAPVHCDKHDLIAVQVSGKKRWFISNDPATLENDWHEIGKGVVPPFESYQTIDVEVGDLIYMPRGTAHTVESTTESIHVSIGFVPTTLREALMAVVDHLSDLDRPLRMGAAERADGFAAGNAPPIAVERVRAAVARLVQAVHSDAFVEEAIEHRLSRIVGNFSRLPAAPLRAPLTPATRMRHSPLATAHLIATPQALDFSQPGEHILVHPGAEPSMRFVAGTSEFAIRDLPGGLTDDVKVALIQRLVNSGFLEVA
jgi:hypothetical protein